MLASIASDYTCDSCGCDSSRENENKSNNNTKRSIELRHSTHNVSKIGRNVENGRLLGYLKIYYYYTTYIYI